MKKKPGRKAISFLSSYTDDQIKQIVLSIFGSRSFLDYRSLVAQIKKHFNIGLTKIQKAGGAIHQLIERGHIQKRNCQYYINYE